jgi:hypothetical protein
MLTILTLALLSGWTYGDFADDPDSARQRPHRPVSPVPTVIIRPVVPASTVAKWTPPAPPPPVPAPPAPPALWRVVDSSGWTWEHSDLEYLRQWVGARNAATASATAPNRAACGPYGQCGR